MPSSVRREVGNRWLVSWGVVGFLLLVNGVIYGQTLGFGFLDYDDGLFVSECPPVRAGVTGGGIAWAFTDGPFGEWYPLSMLSHMLDCQLFGLSPGWHHLTNVLLHAAGSIGLFLVWRSMTGELWPSALVAVLLAVHPQHVESVAWISERRDVLSGLFFVLTLAAYWDYVRHDRAVSRYLLVAVMLSLGLMSKAMLVTVPALLLLLDYWPLGRFGQAADLPQDRPALPRQSFWQLASEKLPLLAIALADGAITLATHSKNRAATPHDWSDAISNAVVALPAYALQFLYPVDLAVFYPLPADGHSAWIVAGSAAVLISMSVATLLARRRCPYVFVGWFWFVGMLVPVLGLVQPAEHTRADRYMYLPSIGLSIALVWGLARLGVRQRVGRLLLGGCAALAIGALTSQAVRQTSYWHDDIGLWEHALATTDDNAEAEDALAFALAKADRLDEAVEHYHRAALWRPDANLLHSLAAVLIRQEKFDEAGVMLRRALELNPAFAPAVDNYGLVLERQGQLEQAAEQYRRAIELDPTFAPPELKLANLLVREGRFEQSIVHFERAVRLDPMASAPRTGLAVALAECGRIDEAIAQCRRALDLSPDDENAQRVLDKLLSSQPGGSSPMDRQRQYSTP